MLRDPQAPLELIEATRFALHAGDYAAAGAFAQRAAHHHGATHAEKTLGRAMRDCARELLGDASHEPFDLQALNGADDLLGEIVYYVALTAFYRRQFDAADTLLRSHTAAEPALRSRYLVMRGLVAGARELFAEQARLTTRAIVILKDEAPENVTLLAGAAHVLAALVREIPFLDGARLLEALEPNVPWTDDLTFNHFHVLRTLAWARALQGDFFGAMRLLHKAQPLARTKALQVYAYLDHASVALFAGDLTSARVAFTIADEIAQAIHWEIVQDETLAVLPLIAQVAADIDGARARSYCELALATAANMEPRWALAHGTRLRAFIGEAIALGYADEKKRSVSEAQSAYDRFVEIGYKWRAARMAIHLFRLTGKTEWRSRAEDHLEAYRESPFARILAVLAREQRSLSSRQREVFDLLLQRKSIDEIAKTLGLSRNTVRVHIRWIHSAYGVRTRSELLRVVASA